MLFNSIEFLIFFPLVTGLYFLLPHKYRWILLLVASCYFYMAFVPVYILILGFTIVIDYFAGIYIAGQQGKRRKAALAISIVANVGVLAFFKYWNFLNANLTELLGFFSAENPIPALDILLPIGLSFHTFQAMSYTIEVYRGNYPAERHFGIYALYVMFYPQLVAGPIERPQNMLPQFYRKHSFDYTRVVQGLRLMLWGFFKKMVIADRLGLYNSDIFDHPGQYQGAVIPLAAIFFAVQVYCDFSAYSDIARGSARVMGFELMLNFSTPLLSRSVTEFWRRWHISLSTWFNDYLYTPFVINHRDWGRIGIIAGLFLTFGISGLWHGAAWTFVIFGLLHAAALTFEFLTKKWRKNISRKIPAVIFNPLTTLLTFSFFVFTVVFFRAHSVTDAFTLLRNTFHWQTGPLFTDPEMFVHFIMGAFFIFVLFGADIFLKDKNVEEVISRYSPVKRWSMYVGVVLLILWFGVFTQNHFIYFQF